jgi:hypothetical protein
MLDKNGKPRTYTTVNGKKMFVDRIFLKLKEGSTEWEPTWIMFFSQVRILSQGRT